MIEVFEQSENPSYSQDFFDDQKQFQTVFDHQKQLEYPIDFWRPHHKTQFQEGLNLDIFRYHYLKPHKIAFQDPLNRDVLTLHHKKQFKEVLGELKEHPKFQYILKEYQTT